jgi:hypothetical protein
MGDVPVDAHVLPNDVVPPVAATSVTLRPSWI